MADTIPKAAVKPIARHRAISAGLAARYGLTAQRPFPNEVAGVVPLEDVWVESTIESEPDWIAACRISIQDGRPVIAELRVFPAEADRPEPGQWSAEYLGREASVPVGGLTTRAVRAVRLGYDVRAVDALVARAREVLPAALSAAGLYGAFGLGDATGTPSIGPRSSTPGARGRPPVPVEAYAQLAASYAALVSAGAKNPVQVLAKRLRLSAAQVRSRLNKARHRFGFLEPGVRGNAGGQLRPQVNAFLKGARRGKAARKG